MGWQVCYTRMRRVSPRTWFDVLLRQRVYESSSEFWLCPKGWQYVEICDLFQNLNIMMYSLTLLTGRMELKQRNMSIVIGSPVKSTCVCGVRTLSSITSLFQNCALKKKSVNLSSDRRCVSQLFTSPCAVFHGRPVSVVHLPVYLTCWCLLDSRHVQIKSACGCFFNFAGNYNGWVEKLPLEGKPFMSSMAALQSFYDVFGDLTAVGATMNISDTGVKYCGEFTPKSGNQWVDEKGLRQFSFSSCLKELVLLTRFAQQVERDWN